MGENEMNNNQLAKTETTQSQLAKSGLDEATYSILLKNDFTKATDQQRAMVVLALCRVSHIEPALTPFTFIETGFGEKKQTKLYAGAGYYEIAANAHGVSVSQPATHWDEKTRMYSCRGYAESNGRRTPAHSVLFIPEQVRGQDLANAFMKAETKYFRRAVKSHLGLTTAVPDIPEELDAAVTKAPTPNAQRAFFAIAEKAGLKDRTARHAFYSAVLGREISDGAELDEHDWSAVLDAAEARLVDNAIDAKESDEIDCYEELRWNMQALGMDLDSEDDEEQVAINAVFRKVLKNAQFDTWTDLQESDVRKLNAWLVGIEAGQMTLPSAWRPFIRNVAEAQAEVVDPETGEVLEEGGYKR